MEKNTVEISKVRYYADPFIRARILEYLGDVRGEDFSAVYISRSDFSREQFLSAQPPQELDYFLDRDLDIARSFWDRRSLLVHLDIEYVNFDFPAEPYLDINRSFRLQDPVTFAVRKLLLGSGIRPLHVLTGRGNHFIWRLELGSPAFIRLANLGTAPPSLKAKYRQWRSPDGDIISPVTGDAFFGLGLVMESLAYRVKEMSDFQSLIPLKLTAVTVGPIDRGREIVSYDISEYADPLYTRTIRIPFTRYLKAREKGITLDGVTQVPQIFVIPFQKMELEDAVRLMRDQDGVRQLARRTSARIPDQSGPSENMVCEYEKSAARIYHEWFYSVQPEEPENWGISYDRISFVELPECARRMLLRPNDILLQPAGIEFIVRVLLSLGWHPRHIAGLIRSKFERDHGWGLLWYSYDATARAEFYTRIFTGQFALGLDDLVDFNCKSNKEKGLCDGLSCDLEPYRRSLLNRRKHGKLGHRPFHGLFLQD